MAGGGSQIILHPRDNSSKSFRDNTRNIGLQSVIYHENTGLNNVTNGVEEIRSQLNLYSELLLELSDRIKDYTLVCNKIWALLQNAYQARNKTAKFLELAVKISEIAK